MNTNGKIAVVTGASAGIGAAIVKALLNINLTVVGLARRKDRVEQLSENSKGKLIALKVDLRNVEEILNAFNFIEENVGPMHVLINNAADRRATPIISGNVETWRSVLDTNLFSVAVTCREAIRTMKENKIDGYIININSVAGRYDAEGSIAANVMYSASKTALMNLTENIRLELGREKSKIRVSSVIPGIVKSEIRVSLGLTQDDVDRVYSEVPHLRCEDVADTVLYLISTPVHVQISELVVRPTGENFEDLISFIRKDK